MQTSSGTSVTECRAKLPHVLPRNTASAELPGEEPCRSEHGLASEGEWEILWVERLSATDDCEKDDVKLEGGVSSRHGKWAGVGARTLLEHDMTESAAVHSRDMGGAPSLKR